MNVTFTTLKILGKRNRFLVNHLVARITAVRGHLLQREWINNRVPKENVSKSAERSVCFPFIVKTREDAVFGNKPVILVS